MAAARPPLQGDKRALVFDGSDPKELFRFFDDVEAIAMDANWDASTTIRRGYLYYAKTDVAEIWETLPEASIVPADAANFKTGVKKLYPSLADGKRYSRGELEQFIAEWAEKGIRTRDEFGTYHREFLRRASYLVRSNKLTENDSKFTFLRGILGQTQKDVLQRLEIKDPDHERGNPYDIDKVATAAMYILSGSAVDQIGADLLSSGTSATTSATTSRQGVTVKKEEVDLSKVWETLKGFQITLESLTRGPNPRSAAGPQPAPLARTPGCAFCSNPSHFIRSCTKVLEYIQAGKCLRDTNSRVVMPNGAFVSSRVPGRNLMEQIDNLLAPNASHPVNIIEVTKHLENPAEQVALAMLQEISEDQQEETDYKVECLEILLNEAKKKAATGRRQKFDGVVIPTKVGPPGKGAMKAQQSPPPNSKPPTTSRSSPQRDDIRKPSNPQPQYCYVVPVEDSNAVSNVLTRTLDTSIMLSQRGLLSIAPKLRKQLKELTTAKRYNAVDVNLVESPSYATQLCGTASQRPEDSILAVATPGVAAEATLPLRTVTAVVEDAMEVECMLDQGAAVCLIREDVWEKLQVPLSPNQSTTIEMADMAKSATIGLIPNAKFTIAGIELSLQVHVVRQAPFQALLGCPFFAITECETKDYTSGIRNMLRNMSQQGFQQTSRN
ncbi:hypothetical protein ACEPAG_7566 [Sanghuangporus baumii]